MRHTSTRNNKHSFLIGFCSYSRVLCVIQDIVSICDTEIALTKAKHKIPINEMKIEHKLNALLNDVSSKSARKLFASSFGCSKWKINQSKMNKHMKLQNNHFLWAILRIVNAFLHTMDKVWCNFYRSNNFVYDSKSWDCCHLQESTDLNNYMFG